LIFLLPLLCLSQEGTYILARNEAISICSNYVFLNYLMALRSKFFIWKINLIFGMLKEV